MKNRRANTSKTPGPVASLTPASGALLQRSCNCGEQTIGGEKCDECAKNAATLRRQHDNGNAPPSVPPSVHETLRAPGEPLASDLRAEMDSRFGFDFSGVRVHADSAAAESARAVSAYAYTVGPDIVFAPGKFAPYAPAGRRLLTHELTHVVQQNGLSGGFARSSIEIGSVDDPLEREADRVADSLMKGESQLSARSLSTSPGEASRPLVQRAVDASAPTTAGPEAKPPPNTTSTVLLISDDAQDVKTGQMRKGEFLDKLEVEVCAAADQELAAVGRTAQGCPYISKWIGHFRKQDSSHVERAVQKYAAGGARITRAGDYIPLVATRVRRGVARWARTGEMSEVPEELTGQLKGGDLLSSAEQMVSSLGGAIAGGISEIGSGVNKAASAIGGIFTKERAGGAREHERPQEMPDRLGEGAPLESGVKSRMEGAFGADLSGIRMHRDAVASELANNLNARAFTVGNHVAFGAGEYQPGSLVGDALIAHEIAHTMQQRGMPYHAAPLTKGDNGFNTLEQDADTSAVLAVLSLRAGGTGRFTSIGKDAMPRLKSGLRLQRCGRGGGSATVDVQEERKLFIDPNKPEPFIAAFIKKNFSDKDQSFAKKILEDMVRSGELSFKDEEALKTEVFKRMRTSKLMQESQKLYGKAFEYPNHPEAKRCLSNNDDGKRNNPRVNKAAEQYWGPVQNADGLYYFDLSDYGKQHAYQALTSLFTAQKSICDMTLIHCDYLASVIHFRAFAESIGAEQFNDRVKKGDIEMRLMWNGFTELEAKGWSNSKADKNKPNVSLHEVRPSSESNLVIGDHVVFWNHRTYDLINQNIRNAWRLENAIIIDRRNKQDIFEGHGSGINTNESMRRKLAEEYNKVANKALGIIGRTRSKDQKTSAAAVQQMNDSFPNIKNEAGEWKVVGNAFGKTFDNKLTTITHTDPDLTGLRDPSDPLKMNCVKRPAESPGEPCS